MKTMAGKACKYRTKSKNLLQNKNQFYRFKKPFLWCSAEQTAPMLNLHSNSATIRVQERHYCMIKVALLECKSGTIAPNDALLRHSLHTSLLSSIISYMSAYYRCTLKTQEFRTKDYVVRRAHSIEH